MSSVSCRTSSIESPLNTVAEMRFRSLFGFLSCCPRTSGAASATKTNAHVRRDSLNIGVLRSYSSYAALWKSSTWRVQLVSVFHLGKIRATKFSNPRKRMQGLNPNCFDLLV